MDVIVERRLMVLMFLVTLALLLCSVDFGLCRLFPCLLVSSSVAPLALVDFLRIVLFFKCEFA